MDVIALLVGLFLLVTTSDLLVRGASSLAYGLGVSPLVIGLTVVAFGTSTPELAVNVVAAIQGNSELSYGNIIGSNIANIGLVIGLTGLLMPMVMHRSIITREIPVMLAVSFGLALMLAADSILSAGAHPVVSRLDGAILLGGLIAFIIMMIRITRSQRKDDVFLAELAKAEPAAGKLKPMMAMLLTVVGIVGVIAGSHFTVEGATGIARLLGVPEAVIGLTLVAVGTSLPELTTSIQAARQGHADIAVGNIVGSNILNILAVLSLTALINPVFLPPGGWYDLAVMLGLSVVFLPLAFTHQFRIVRWEGALLLGVYLVYTGWRGLSSAGSVPGAAG